MADSYDIFSGPDALDDWLRRGGDDLAVPDNFSANMESAVLGFGGTGGLTMPESSIMPSPITGTTNLSEILSGSEVGGILAFGKRSFSDTATEGWIQGMKTDGTYAWLIGGSSSSIDWNVTTPSVLTIVGAITATTGTIGGFSIGATTISATNLTLTSGAANTANIAVGTGANLGGMNSGNAGTDIAFWAGATFANRATAPFRVNLQGDVTATSITLPADVIDLKVWADILGDYFNRADAPIGNSTVTSYGSVARFADGLTPSGIFKIKTPKGATSVSSIKVFFERNATGNLYIQFASAYYAATAGGTIGSDNSDTYAAYTVSGGTGVADFITVPAAAYNALVITSDNIIELTIFRDSSNASDTYNTFWPVAGVLFSFA